MTTGTRVRQRVSTIRPQMLVDEEPGCGTTYRESAADVRTIAMGDEGTVVLNRGMTAIVQWDNSDSLTEMHVTLLEEFED